MKNPNKGGKGLLIDYNYTMLMVPALEFGAIIGVIVNIIFPEIVIIGIISAILLFVFVSTTIKLKKIYS